MNKRRSVIKPKKSSEEMSVVWEYVQSQDTTTAIDQIYEILFAETVEETVDRRN